MNNFEATILITPNTTKKKLEDILKFIEKSIIDKGGAIIGKEDWGLRDLAYKIGSLKKAFYIFYQIKVLGKEIQTLKKNLSINEDIIRQLFIKVDSHIKLPTKVIESKE